MEALVEIGDVAAIRALVAEAKEKGEDEEILSTCMERAVRGHAIKLASQHDQSHHVLVASVRQLLDTAITLTSSGILSAKATPVLLMQDVFDMSCIPSCKMLFGLLEERMDSFKQPPLAEACQSFVLRLCNDILRRLSRSVETSFSGRILFFLSRFLPLSDKSALNVIGQFNTANVTKYETFQTDAATTSTELVARDEDMDIGDSKHNKESNIPVDHALYTKFWQMQQFFCNPNSCYEKANWKLLQRDATEVLNVLASYKLERTSGEESDENGRSAKRRKTESMEAKDEDDYYFAKYLTNPKLLHLQLNDSHFRRYFLVQCLILFQYLLADTKFKGKLHVLAEEDKKFVRDSNEKALRLLRETHPRGAHFAESIEDVLEREKRWSEWKNSGCPELAPATSTNPLKTFKKRERGKFNPDSVDLGSAELTKLWQLQPDIMAACRDPKRKFAPSLKTFLQGPLEEMDPEQQVDEEYKSVRSSSFQWRAARLLLSANALYISPNGTSVTQSMAPFLEAAIVASAKHIPELKESLAWMEKETAASPAKKSPVKEEVTDNSAEAASITVEPKVEAQEI